MITRFDWVILRIFQEESYPAAVYRTHPSLARHFSLPHLYIRCTALWKEAYLTRQIVTEDHKATRTLYQTTARGRIATSHLANQELFLLLSKEKELQIASAHIALQLKTYADMRKRYPIP